LSGGRLHDPDAITFLTLDAALILFLAIGTGIFLTTRKARLIFSSRWLQGEYFALHYTIIGHLFMSHRLC
jgi:hypothetical protein